MVNNGREISRIPNTSEPSNDWIPSGNRYAEVGNKLGKLMTYLANPNVRFGSEAAARTAMI
jgi:hypothetical protein